MLKISDHHRHLILKDIKRVCIHGATILVGLDFIATLFGCHGCIREYTEQFGKAGGLLACFGVYVEHLA
jgi:hypothetical protein